jgi:hypothetical protein
VLSHALLDVTYTLAIGADVHRFTVTPTAPLWINRHVSKRLHLCTTSDGLCSPPARQYTHR